MYVLPAASNARASLAVIVQADIAIITHFHPGYITKDLLDKICRTRLIPHFDWMECSVASKG
ncbi:uncharacterized protein PHACADRAFT_246094 [Phanerochaete carnosa HHB-10118-sp]|uniref:Uncharacterized protein n=1 Tax=Phanerochaete carnosa (strain HHB-10118-sp) TaxID=650164 RepID=K5WLC6_PHACS|nr:uncharacterized protein PHACADRAFT_246094 [Phanerochaete carnosa HHB-10118-sp]EKM60235.1 hypothetical protein PHACADRAFT_246094 [Phanerochaete carnosa HHB-10118-sp]